MSGKSFIYRNIFIYRFVMNLLYLGKYKKRFQGVIEQMNSLPKGSEILELCFGDVYLAQFADKAGHKWKGLDVNDNFVKTARSMGFEAHCVDLAGLESFPQADVCVMMGSLYHFHPNIGSVMAKMFKASNCVVISEPVSNLASQGGLVGFLAKRAANAGKGREAFRFTRSSFMAMVEKNREVLGYQIAAIQDHGKDIIVKLQK